jgi:mRNA interferase YafQ
MRQIIKSTRFRKDFKRCEKRGADFRKLTKILELLINDEPLPPRCRLHKLVGSYAGFWECHIEPDWLLVFDLSEELLELVAMGSHSDLFE